MNESINTEFKDRTMDPFEFENGFYGTASVARISKFVTHLDLFRAVSGRPGEIVECGVFKGASLFRWIKFRALLENTFSRRIVAFDIFGDFPDVTYAPDKERRDAFVLESGGRGPSKGELEGMLRAQNLLENVELVSGDVCETVPTYVDRHSELRIALLNIDVDLYEPTRCSLTALFPHVVPGGIVILDDYGAFPGANKAIEEYFGDSGEKILKLPYSSALSYVMKGGDGIVPQSGRMP